MDEDGLLAKPIARQNERSSRRVPHCEGEHAIELLHERFAVTLVQMDDDLGIRARAEGVALLGKLVTKLLEVVDLAVENGPHALVLAALRLIAGDEVDDPKTSHAESRV